MNTYARTPSELKEKAVLFWPHELSVKEQSASIIPMLISTQDKFISILDVSDSSPDSWKLALRATRGLYANLFLKHLMVLSDVGGEALDRIKPEFAQFFPNQLMTYQWKGKSYRYTFQAIPTCRKLDNRTLFVDGKRLKVERNLDPLTEDAIMLLLHGAAVTSGTIPDPIRERCIIGALMGEKDELEKFVKQRYIWVSRITGGATSNAMGQIAQDYVKDMLANALPDWTIIRNGSIPGMSQNAGDTDMSFDVVARSPNGRWVAIEVSFQFTTNSVINEKRVRQKHGQLC